MKYLIAALCLVSVNSFAFMANEGDHKMPEKCGHCYERPKPPPSDTYEIMQGYINESVEMQNEVEKIQRQNEGKLNHSEMCRAVAIYQSQDVYGEINSVKYMEIYGRCLSKKK